MQRRVGLLVVVMLFLASCQATSVRTLDDLTVSDAAIQAAWDDFVQVVTQCMEAENLEFSQPELTPEIREAITFVNPFADPRLDRDSFLQDPYGEFRVEIDGSGYWDYETESDRYYRVLYGESADADDYYSVAYQTVGRNLTDVPAGESGGCFGVAKETALPPVRSLSRLQGEANVALARELRRDDEFRDAENKWSSCVEEEGYDRYGSYRELGTDVYPLPDWFGYSDDPRSAKFKSDAEVKDLANADLTCFERHLSDVLDGARSRLEGDFLFDNAAEIDEYIAFWASRTAE